MHGISFEEDEAMSEYGAYRKLVLLNDGGYSELKDIEFPLEVECELDGENLAIVDKSEFYFDDDELNNSRDYFIFAIGIDCKLANYSHVTWMVAF